MENEPNGIEQPLDDEEKHQLDMVIRAIELAKGKFALAFALFENPEQQTRVINELTKRISDMQIVDIQNKDETVSFATFLEDKLQDRKTRKQPFSVVILEGFTAPEEDYHSEERQYLSGARESIEKVYDCLVICADMDENMGSWVAESPDWYRYRSHTFTFSHE